MDRPLPAGDRAAAMKAVIDIGSNSILLLIASRGPDGALAIARDEATVARLSQGVAASGRLATEAVARALEVLRRYRAIAAAEGIESLEAVATEGLRMAENPEDFLEPAAEILGAPVRMISGDEEAALSYRSIALEQPADQPLRVVDIGGASTELIVGRGLDIEQAVSHRMGSVRMSERFIDGHPPSASAIAAIAAAARDCLAAQPLAPAPELVGLAGTVTTIGALAAGLERYERDRVDGLRLDIDRIRALRDELATWSLERLQAVPLLGKGRADLIVTGATLLLALLEHCGADTLVIRDRGLRYALL
ncbi:Ppx/GppA family phosphatase [Pseudenhygromyxa sp. WMMC2535]|uniref:Ppx/GppA phosphatase family protein n=1 Tax=Pseudenhygromyxa sp. WMMC2535 TaxID=2712867 RepID=UPI0015581B1D|nr:Ppx/GppA family phosphatase [Pseudenhygromyxa sp. WMMC2535]NVB37947.1 Ppx/GppA family phosphatase [Pseudenhygromyxa sp. WMMC2535]